MNARRALLLVAVLLALAVTPGAAQGNIEVLIPVHGVFAAIETTEINGMYQEQRNLIDGFTGSITPIEYEYLGASPELHWSPDGSQIAIPSSQLSVVSIWREADNLVQAYTLAGSRYYAPVGWSSDGQSILLVSYVPGVPGTRSHSLSRFEPETGTQTMLLTFAEGESITGFPLPNGITELQFYEFRQINVNSTYDNWLLLQIACINPAEMGTGEGGSVPETAYVNLTMLWNSQTGTVLSLNDFLGSNIGSSPIPWHPDGQRLYLTTSGSQQSEYHVVRFDPLSQSLEDIRSASGPPATMKFWLGAGNLMIGEAVGDNPHQIIYYLTELQDSGWQSMEFMRLERNMALDWRLTASEEERRQLACLFDQTLPSQLAVGLTGQVAFTDGTPSRLRSAPDRYSAQVTMMAEGTPFTVLDGPTCMDGYRWWQLRLADETVGWAAEADITTYFLEPLP